MEIVKSTNDKWTWNKGFLRRIVSNSTGSAIVTSNASCTWPVRPMTTKRTRPLPTYAMTRRPSKRDKRKTGINNRFDFSSQISLSHVLEFIWAFWRSTRRPCTWIGNLGLDYDRIGIKLLEEITFRNCNARWEINNYAKCHESPFLPDLGFSLYKTPKTCDFALIWLKREKLSKLTSNASRPALMLYVLL